MSRRGAAISNWIFEETHTFMEVSGALAFWMVRDDIPCKGILKMWGWLRSYAIFFLQYRPGQHTIAQIRAAQQQLYQYASYAQQHLGGRLMTVLLHRAVVHIPEQVIYGVPSAYMREDWGERCIRRVKGAVKGHAMNKVAAAAAARCCMDMQLADLRTRHPELHKPIEDALPQAATSSFDEGDDYGCQLHALKDAYTGIEGDEVRGFIRRS